MNAYYVAEGEAVTGPFAEEQLVNMWRMGQITANAQVCLEGTEEWVSIRTEINTIEAFKPKVTREMRGVYSSAPAAKGAQLNVGVAVLLTLLITGAGHLYAREPAGALVFFIMQIVVVLTFWPLVVIIWIVAILHVMEVVNKANAAD